MSSCPLVHLLRTSCLATCWENSRTVTAGRSSGWSSPTSAFSSTNHIRSDSQGWARGWSVLLPVFNVTCRLSGDVQDNYPLASLPLLGYSVTVPSESENIHKDYVFKLHFKSHVYYFRSESEYTFERWGFCSSRLFLICVLWYLVMSSQFKYKQWNYDKTFFT